MRWSLFSSNPFSLKEKREGKQKAIFCFAHQPIWRINQKLNEENKLLIILLFCLLRSCSCLFSLEDNLQSYLTFTLHTWSENCIKKFKQHISCKRFYLFPILLTSKAARIFSPAIAQCATMVIPIYWKLQKNLFLFYSLISLENNISFNPP